MVSWLIHHIFAVSIYFLKAWDSILEQFTDEWMWSYVAWCTTVNLTFHGMFTAFCLHQYRCHPCHCFFFFATFAISSAIMLTHCWMTLLNTLAGIIELLLFACKPVKSGSSFHIFLLMLVNLLWTYVSPFSHSIQKMLYCLHLF